MCILLLHYHPDPSSQGDEHQPSGGTNIGHCNCPYIIVAADNRDEFFDRPTAPLAFWEEKSSILAGRDMEGAELHERGTWMGVSREKRFAVLTNYRTHPHEHKKNPKTRGCLVSDYLAGNTPPMDYSNTILENGEDYNGFSLITANTRDGEKSEVVCCSNRDSRGAYRLGPGNYCLSNALLDSPWRKVQRGRDRLVGVMEGVGSGTDEGHLVDQLMEILADDTSLHPDPNLPDTGFPEEILRPTSSIFVSPVNFHGRTYGTRTSSVMLMKRSGEVTFTERTRTFPLLPDNAEWTTTQHCL